MKRKQLIRNRIEQKTAARKRDRREFWRKEKDRTKKSVQVNDGPPIVPTLTGTPSGRSGEFVKTLRRNKK